MQNFWLPSSFSNTEFIMWWHLRHYQVYEVCQNMIWRCWDPARLVLNVIHDNSVYSVKINLWLHTQFVDNFDDQLVKTAAVKVIKIKKIRCVFCSKLISSISVTFLILLKQFSRTFAILTSDSSAFLAIASISENVSSRCVNNRKTSLSEIFGLFLK